MRGSASASRIARTTMERSISVTVSPAREAQSTRGILRALPGMPRMLLQSSRAPQPLATQRPPPELRLAADRSQLPPTLASSRRTQYTGSPSVSLNQGNPPLPSGLRRFRGTAINANIAPLTGSRHPGWRDRERGEWCSDIENAPRLRVTDIGPGDSSKRLEPVPPFRESRIPP